MLADRTFRSRLQKLCISQGVFCNASSFYGHEMSAAVGVQGPSGSLPFALAATPGLSLEAAAEKAGLGNLMPEEVAQCATIASEDLIQIST